MSDQKQIQAHVICVRVADCTPKQRHQYREMGAGRSHCFLCAAECFRHPASAPNGSLTICQQCEAARHGGRKVAYSMSEATLTTLRSLGYPAPPGAKGLVIDPREWVDE